MNLQNLTGADAIAILKKYYPDMSSKKYFNFSDYSCPIDGGDGSSNIRWDLIDFKGERLLKITDYYDSENSGYEPIEGCPKAEDIDLDVDWLEHECLYDQISENSYGDKQTALEVDELFNIILRDALK